MPARKKVIAKVNVHYEGRIILADQEITDLPAEVVDSLLESGGAKKEN